jgi:hypothetical protein
MSGVLTVLILIVVEVLLIHAAFRLWEGVLSVIVGIGALAIGSLLLLVWLISAAFFGDGVLHGGLGPFHILALAGTSAGMFLCYAVARRGYRLRLEALDTPDCATCGYNLTGNQSGICPECGVRIESAKWRFLPGRANP